MNRVFLSGFESMTKTINWVFLVSGFESKIKKNDMRLIKWPKLGTNHGLNPVQKHCP